MSYYLPTILIQDDEVEIVCIIKKLLSKNNYKILTSNNGDEGLLILQKNKVDVIITDIKMPFKSGIEFSQKAREMYPDIEIIVCSGIDTKKYLCEVADIGISATIPKPFNSKEFIEVVEEVVNKCRLQFLHQNKYTNSVVINSGPTISKIGNYLYNNSINTYQIRDKKELLELMVTVAKSSTTSISVVILDYPSVSEWQLNCQQFEDSEIIITLSERELKNENIRSWCYENYGLYVMSENISEKELIHLIKNTITRIKVKQELKYKEKIFEFYSNSAKSQGKALIQCSKDIIKESDSLVEKQNKMLAHADRLASLGVIAAGVAHEINNPNSVIRVNLQLLERYWKKINEIIYDYIKQNKNNEKDTLIQKAYEDIPSTITDSIEGTERIKKIVSDLKSFAHSPNSDSAARNADGNSLGKEEINVYELIEKAISLTRHKHKHLCTIEKGYAKDNDQRPALIYAQSVGIEQVFVNIILNAVDAIKEKELLNSKEMIEEKYKGSILINGHIETEKELIITVQDNGIGIKEVDLKKIFDPFFTTKPIGEGTGLGLMVAYNIITEHKGRIEVESTYLKGSIIKIYLPLIIRANS
ncbi:MAG: response regulator [Oligoflexia bacterium]|nr:response regulator [Oligoflexia bacterium]